MQPFCQSLPWVVIIAQKKNPLHVVLLLSVALMGSKLQEEKGHVLQAVVTLKKR